MSPAPTLPSKRDWMEDATLESGRYINTCVPCGKTFFGHKRRCQCKSCFTKVKRKAFVANIVYWVLMTGAAFVIGAVFILVFASAGWIAYTTIRDAKLGESLMTAAIFCAFAVALGGLTALFDWSVKHRKPDQ